MSVISEINTLLQQGRSKKVKECVSTALGEGYSPETILNEGLLEAMSEVGRKFKADEIFVPEVLIAARAMNSGLEVLRPYLVKEGIESKGTAVIGTVKGDLHDIGKNLVRMMIEGRGLTVIDLGVDVSAEQFCDAAVEHNARIVCCSALLTTTMTEMRAVVEEFKSRGLRDKVKIMIGGAPVTQAYCDEIGADFYADNAASAAELALEIVSRG
ncbi:MAG: cobalamin B12-binding domain-containing protein [Oscillospiraceae bacterium]|jgi:corrinoid protein of di/trimethylamine methyltransferase